MVLSAKQKWYYNTIWVTGCEVEPLLCEAFPGVLSKWLRFRPTSSLMTQECKEKVLASHLCARFLCFSEPTTIETLNPYFNIVSGHPAQLGTRYKLWGLVRD